MVLCCIYQNKSMYKWTWAVQTHAVQGSAEPRFKGQYPYMVHGFWDPEHTCPDRVLLTLKFWRKYLRGTELSCHIY